MVDFKDMTEEEQQKIIEDAATRSAQNMGAPKDMWIVGYGQILKDGKPTESGLQWYEDHKEELERK